MTGLPLFWATAKPQDGFSATNTVPTAITEGGDLTGLTALCLLPHF
jgi:hypothetical protein